MRRLCGRGRVLGWPPEIEMRREEFRLESSNERVTAFAGRGVPPITLAGFVALAAAWLGIVYFAEPWGASALPSGMDARCYWVPDLANPYLHSNWTDQIAYPYSPAFLQILQPLRLLPWQAFMGAWALILMAALVYLTGPRLILLGLAFFGLMEIWGGNIELLIAVAIVAGFRWPAAWAFVLLTKITPGVGLLWFAVRREWRALAIALGATVAVAAISYAVAPNAWLQWKDVLFANAGKSGTWAAVPIPFWVRLGPAIAVVVWGALTNRRWTVPIASMLALPALWYGGLSIALAALPLVEARTWGDVVRVGRDAVSTVERWAGAAALRRRHPATARDTAPE